MWTAAHDELVDLGGGLLVFLLIALLLGCGASASPFGGGDAGELGGAGGAGGRCAATDCWNGSRCVPDAEQTDDECITSAGTCGATALSCSGFQGTCAIGEEQAARGRCHPNPTSPGASRAVCCPANVCTYDACQ